MTEMITTTEPIDEDQMAAPDALIGADAPFTPDERRQLRQLMRAVGAISTACPVARRILDKE